MHQFRRRNIGKSNEDTYKHHVSFSFICRSRPCPEICRANAFYSVNHMVYVHAAFSEKLFYSVQLMLVCG